MFYLLSQHSPALSYLCETRHMSVCNFCLWVVKTDVKKAQKATEKRTHGGRFLYKFFDTIALFMVKKYQAGFVRLSPPDGFRVDFLSLFSGSFVLLFFRFGTEHIIRGYLFHGSVWIWKWRIIHITFKLLIVGMRPYLVYSVFRG